MFQKIQFHDAISFLEKSPIENCNIIGYLKNSEKKTIWTDDKLDPKGILVMNGYFRYVYSMENVFAEKVRNYFLNHKRDVGFSGVEEKTAKILIGEEQCSWRNPCYFFYFPNKRCPLKEDKKVRRLTLEDAKEIDYYYTYRSKWSIYYIKECIQRRPAYGYVENEELVSWLLVHEDDSMGIMYTKEPYRKKGMGKVLTNYVTHDQCERQRIPYLHILTDNENSIKLAEVSGFQRAGIVDWFGLQRPKNSME